MRERAVVEEVGAEPARLAIGRVRLRSLWRVGFSVGWVISLLPSLLAGALLAWMLHGIWGTLDGWTPWRPWDPNASVGPLSLPAPPEFRPREALRVDGFYRAIEPIGQHPFLGAALGTLALTILGGILFAIILVLAGGVYNLFVRVTGGIEFEMVPRERRQSRALPAPARPARQPRRKQRERDEDWLAEDETKLRW